MMQKPKETQKITTSFNDERATTGLKRARRTGHHPAHTFSLVRLFDAAAPLPPPRPRHARRHATQRAAHPLL
jgi:hypothetical protein